MLTGQRFRRCARLALPLALLVSGLLVGTAAAADTPDFYGTIVGVSADRGTVTVKPEDSSQLVMIDVRNLGSEPFTQGAFAVNNVVLLHTFQSDNKLVAYGWEQARDGSESFNGVEREPRPRRAQERDDD